MLISSLLSRLSTVRADVSVFADALAQAERNAGAANLHVLAGTAILCFFAGVGFASSKWLSPARLVLLAAPLAAAFASRASTKWDARRPIVSCLPEQDLVVRRGSGLSAGARASLLATLLAHPNATGQHLSHGAFAQSRGFVLKFNAEGGAANLGDADGPWHFLEPFFDAARDPAANAFVLNALIVAPTAQSVMDDDDAIALHIDNTVGIDSDYNFIAHSVSVLYLTMPTGHSGGDLLLFPPSPIWFHATPNPDFPPSARITPSTADGQEFIIFRGDVPHRVSAMNPSEAAQDEKKKDEEKASAPASGSVVQQRVSLVLEQYRIGAAHYGQTNTFAVNQRFEEKTSWWRRAGL